MTFTQVDDAWPDSPDVLTVSRSARLLEIEGKCYCNRHLTDGRITRTQWLRTTDTETFSAEVEELVSAGLATEVEPGVYQLDWSQQQTREQVLKARARKREDNERRARSLELHKAGDHSLCTHAGGGRAGGRRATDDSGQSSGPSTGKSIRASSGRSTGKSTGKSIRASSGHAHSTPTPTHPTPARSGTEGGVGGRARGASAGAPAAAAASEGGGPDGRTVHPYGPPPPGIPEAAWVLFHEDPTAGLGEDPDAADAAERLDGLLPGAAR